MIKLGLILFFAILLILPSFAQDRSLDKVISIDLNDWTVKQVLEQITRQSGFNFSYNARIIDTRAVISFGIRNGNLEAALELLRNSIDVDYFLVDQQIVLTRAEDVSRTEIDEEIYVTVSGYLTDENSGESLIGATVSIAGTSQGTTTNAFGYFALRVGKGEHRLMFSYVGYQDKTIPIQLKSDLSIDIKLGVASIDLPNVIVSIPSRQIISERDLGRMELNPTSRLPFRNLEVNQV
ncbi:MAG: carboxypeptidase-like regulatory domain-containing protein [Saprospiraceae bacterium]|nr:carboxypeptidase-like regulatory domain-containing protein [Saprospiraceae bacterium]